MISHSMSRHGEFFLVNWMMELDISSLDGRDLGK
jgi:hypothetical protein